MKFRVSGCVFVLLVVLQLSNADGDQNEEGQLLLLNKKVENFIKQILHTIRSYSKEMRENSHCISDEVMDSAMATLRRSIDCVESNEKEYGLGKMNAQEHRKQFLRCFSQAKEEVKNWLRNSTKGICPEKPTEKTYEINVTTALTKTFLIKIRNGVNVTNKKFQLSHVNEPSPEFKDESKSWTAGNSLEDSEAEKKATTVMQVGAEVWSRYNATNPDDMYVEQTNASDEEENMVESTTKDAVGVGEMQGHINRNSTVHSEEDSDSEEYDYGGDNI